MNESINVATNNSSTAAVAGKSHGVKAASGIDSGAEAADSVDNEHSFSDSLSKVSEHTDTEKGGSNADEGGNSLPVSDDSSEIVAEDDHASLATIIETILGNSEQPQGGFISTDPNIYPNIDSNITESQLASQDSSQLITDTLAVNVVDQAKQVSLDGSMKGEAGTGLMSSSTQPVSLQSTLHNIVSDVAKSDTTKLSTDAEIKQLDMSQLSLDKKLFSGTGKQSQSMFDGLQAHQSNILNEIQSSLSQRLDASSMSSRSDAINIPLTQAANSTPLNPQTSPLLAGISEPFGRPGWSQEMGKQIVWMANQNIKSAEIRLNPAHLGPIEVRLEINDDQINVALSSRHAAVREAMETTMPKLREMLDNDGLNLAGSDISHQSFAEQHEQYSENDSNGKANALFVHAEQDNMLEDVVMQKATSIGMVDYFI